MAQPQLMDQVVLVTGGGSGIGLGIARALAAEGCRVVITGRTEATLKKAVAETAATRLIQYRVCDVANRGQVQQTFEWLAREVGPIDILVNSAGINVPKRMFSDMDPADFDRVMGVNATGTFNCMHSAISVMRPRQRGLIINIVSVAGRRTLLLAGLPYVASKFAAAAMGNFANMELAKEGIRVTNVFPGEANTPILDKRPAPPPADKRETMIQPEDVGAAVVMVAKLPARAIVPELVITPAYMILD